MTHLPALLRVPVKHTSVFSVLPRTSFCPVLPYSIFNVERLLKHQEILSLIHCFFTFTVLQELDDMKREQSAARDAIRWLETQLRSGSRFLRAQRPGQARPLPLLKYPRKAPPYVHNFIQILEFCNHFVADEKQSQGGNGDPDNSLQGKSTPLFVLLVGDHPGGEEEYKEFSLTGAAQAAGISVEHIGDFYTKWRQTVHKNGKKRWTVSGYIEVSTAATGMVSDARRFRKRIESSRSER